MNYDFYLDKVLLPVSPERLYIRAKSGNKTLNLINEGQASVIKKGGLLGVEFECLLPAEKYPFARYPDGFKTPDYFTRKLAQLKEERRPFQFIVTRTGAGGALSSTNLTVTLEDYALSESAANLFDTLAEIQLREYRRFGAKTIKLSSDGYGASSDRQPSTVRDAPVGIGSAVIVNGRLYKNSYGARPGRVLTNYRGLINYINLRGSHPYHVTTPEGGWLGWVTADSVKAVT